MQGQAALTAHAGQYHLGIQRNQQWHGVANWRSIGHIAAQRATVAHGQAGKARGKFVQLWPQGFECGESFLQRGGGTNAQVSIDLCNHFQLGSGGDVQHHLKTLVVLGHPQAHIGAAGHYLGLGVL